MAFLHAMSVIGSGLTAQKLRLDVVSENITNINTTRTENGDGPYRRKVVTFQEIDAPTPFEEAMARAYGKTAVDAPVGGVMVTTVEDDESAFKLTYDPSHPDANEEGYVELPNVDLVKEMADAMAANQAYSANVTAFNVLKQVASKSLEIGKA